MFHSSKSIGMLFVLLTTCLFRLSAEAKYGGGSGTAEDPYLIYTAEQMNTIGLHEEDWDKHFMLMTDIDLGQYTGTQFNIIGYFTPVIEIKPFTGIFDGNGHTISNFSYTSSGTNNIGLFRYVRYAEIKDLKLVDPNITAEQGVCIGALAGDVSQTTIKGCCVEGGSVFGEIDVGGLVGYSTDLHISSCYSTTNVQGIYRVGGLVGWAYWGDFSECYSNSVVTGKDDIGGLLGSGGNKIDSCYSDGSISGQIDVGGLVGYNHATIMSSYSIAVVVGIYEHAGGLVGSNNGTLKSCWASGDVQGKYVVGGLAGANSGTITHCYATGTVHGDRNVSGFVGTNTSRILLSYSTGLVLGNEHVAGFSSGGSVYLCYWDTETSGVAESPGGKGKNTAEMQSASTYRGWGYESQWVIDDGSDYPHLLWEDKPGELLIDPPRNYGGGTGETNSPYQISTTEHLVCLGYYLEDFDKHYVLTDDIDLSTIDPNEVMPIGISGVPFMGSFIGNGYVISNFRCHFDGQDFVGLFGYIGLYAYIGSVDLIDVAVSGRRYVGGLAGCNVGTVECCSIAGTVVGTDITGGLAGSNRGSIIACSTSGEVVGNSMVGGLVGDNFEDISACYSVSSVTGNKNVGGIVGNNGHPSMSHALARLEWMPTPADSAISSCYCIGSVEGQENTGGLVGVNAGSIMLCCSASPVICTSSPTDDSTNDDRRLISDSDAPIRTVDSSGTSASKGETSIGGLLGKNNYGIVTLSYWDTKVSGQSYSAGGKGKKTEQMMTAWTFRGWGYADQWIIDEGNDYPHLVWEGLLGESIADDCNRYSSGTGEPNDPYRIRTADDFINVGHHLGDWDKCFVLANDVDLNDVDPNEICPIGVYTLPFTGVFDGNDHTISNFSYFSETENYLGVFGTIGEMSFAPDGAEGFVVNLNLENVHISGYLCVGGLAGFKRGIIYGCSTHCDITAQHVAGGLLGYNLGPVTACSASGSVKAEGTYSSCIGGLIGESAYDVKWCHFSGSVAGGDTIGGLIGFNKGAIVGCSSKANITGSEGVGGLVGENQYGNSISKSYSMSNVAGQTSVGCVVGSNRGEIVDCYSTGCVEGGEYVAGLAGENHEIIMFCYSTCTVNGQQSVAGLVGYSHRSEIISCFWDTDISGLTDGVADQDPDPENIFGLSTIQMQTASTFIEAGWDFVGETKNGTEDIWSICEGANYPKLTWQFVVGDFDSDNDTDFEDFCILAEHWLGTGSSFWCDGAGADLTSDGNVNFNDLKVLAENWLAGPWELIIDY